MEQKSSGLIKALTISLVFFIGFFTAYLISSLYNSNLEMPFSLSSSTSTPAPHDFVKESNILVYPDRIVIELDNASISSYASSGSMLPLFDKGANGIRIKPKSADEINVGDIVSYTRNNELIVHRIIEKGTDENGTYFIPKGDANKLADEKIRFSDIEYITIGVLY